MLIHLLRLIRTVLAEIVGILLRKTVLAYLPQGKRRENMGNENKLNLDSKGVFGILLAAAAALVCAAIDYFIEENDDDD